MLRRPMPELPEVETTRRGVRPHVRGRRIEAVIVRDGRLRWPVPANLPKLLTGRVIADVERRAKYLLFRLRGRGGVDAGTLIGHLGMSGSLRVLRADAPTERHDHVDVVLEGGRCLRLRDPRRFGCLLYTGGDPLAHELLKDLGPEPLSAQFDGARLAELARGRTAPVKCFLMDGAVVVGVGNIYANEALWRAGIHPRRAAGRVASGRYDALARAVKEVLAAAIEKGGTTLRDFVGGDGSAGHFQTRHWVYDRAGEPCRRCGAPVRRLVQGQRASFFCLRCQK